MPPFILGMVLIAASFPVEGRAGFTLAAAGAALVGVGLRRILRRR